MDTFMRELRALIRQMQIELTPNNSFLKNILDDQRNRTLRVQATEATQLIRELQDSLYKVEYSDNWPLLRVLIAFCYCRLNDIHSARLWAEDAVRILKATNKESNLALAYWFLAEIYSQEGYFKDSREQYINAQNTLKQIGNSVLNSNAGYKTKKECRRRIRHIQRRINDIAQERSRLLDSARKDQKVNIATGNNDQSPERAGEHNSGGIVFSAPINVDVHVPIDNRSADHFDQRSLQYTNLQQDQFANQDQESLLGTSTPVGIDFTNITKQPEVATPKPLDGKKPADADNEAPIPVEVPYFGYLMTPSLPIYGTASAGPNGEVVLDEPNYNAAIDESTFVRLDGEDYEVYPLRSDNRRIKISHKDFLTSIIPRKMREIGRKAYGWLRVTGNSMNETKLITNDPKKLKIEDGDYVLFIENNNIDASVGKIVIVSESLPDSGPIRLLVKRLVKKNNQWFLRSHSSDEFKDLDFDDCYQLIGEVIAVAKPRMSEET